MNRSETLFASDIGLFELLITNLTKFSVTVLIKIYLCNLEHYMSYSNSQQMVELAIEMSVDCRKRKLFNDNDNDL